MIKLIRTSTVPGSLNHFCRGLLGELRRDGYEVVAVSSPGEALREIADREEVKTIVVPMERRMSPFKDLKSLWRLIRVFRRERPDMVHSITPKAGLLSMLAARVCRVPVRLHTFTGLVFPTATGLTRRILMLTDRLTCACATHIVPEGEGVKDDLVRYRITRKPLQVLGFGNIRGIDLTHFDPALPQLTAKVEPIRRKGIFTFVFVGRLVGDKGINELVEAFSKLNAAYSDTRLLLVGEKESDLDPLSPETLREIDRHPAIGAVGPQDDVRPWLVAADAFVFPSYREGFPNVVIEAGAMGLPSIVTDINGSREIIREGENGVIVPSKNVKSLYDAMACFIAHPEEVARMAAAARPLIASRFEQGFVQQCLKDYYKEILAS